MDTVGMWWMILDLIELFIVSVLFISAVSLLWTGDRLMRFTFLFVAAVAAVWLVRIVYRLVV